MRDRIEKIKSYFLKLFPLPNWVGIAVKQAVFTVLMVVLAASSTILLCNIVALCKTADKCGTVQDLLNIETVQDLLKIEGFSFDSLLMVLTILFPLYFRKDLTRIFRKDIPEDSFHKDLESGELSKKFNSLRKKVSIDPENYPTVFKALFSQENDHNYNKFFKHRNSLLETPIIDLLLNGLISLSPIVYIFVSFSKKDNYFEVFIGIAILLGVTYVLVLAESQEQPRVEPFDTTFLENFRIHAISKASKMLVESNIDRHRPVLSFGIIDCISVVFISVSIVFVAVYTSDLAILYHIMIVWISVLLLIFIKVSDHYYTKYYLGLIKSFDRKRDVRRVPQKITAITVFTIIAVLFIIGSLAYASYSMRIVFPLILAGILLLGWVFCFLLFVQIMKRRVSGIFLAEVKQLTEINSD